MIALLHLPELHQWGSVTPLQSFYSLATGMSFALFKWRGYLNKYGSIKRWNAVGPSGFVPMSAKLSYEGICP